ncbi:ankyrin repeat domain-containing protein [Pedobacter frigidisoli]|uniref:Ankyrin repeat domain-containing protein n=1 Tax=Pedobacter frigidisoli TaxID=2530455 RepID=A0A4R0NWF6_9SPHI|nr:ankyrin repeat domain-containing protein [Pedobacter frigidisoli]TCD05597.1 ankyrin repeat domain-containing protein [Pedobacter frigidisoli]
MKKILLVVTLFWSISLHAQKNSLLDQAFWQAKPDVSAVKAEVAKGANPSQLNGMSFDPVVMAINADASTETIKYLLAQPGNEITKLTHDGRIYLHWAASKGNDEIVNYLVSKGSNLSLKDSHGVTAMTFAAGAGQQNTKIYDLFIAKGANLKTDVNGNGANVLLLAIGSDKDFKLTDYFISKGLDLKSVDADGTNAFGYAARAGNLNILKALIVKGIPVDQNAIILASEGSRRGSAPIEVFEYLESLKIKPTATNKDGRNVLHALVRRPKQNELIQHFLTAGADVNQADIDGNNVLMNAAMSNRDTAVFALLLPKVKNINTANNKGLTALAMAVNGNSPAVVAYLISKGADVNSIDKDGNNLAYYLLQSYSPAPEAGRAFNGPSKAEEFQGKMVLLKEKGFNLGAPQKNGNTLYHLAVIKGDLSLFKSLQPLNINVNAQNKEGLTALHRAAMVSKDDAILQYLLSIGAKKDIKTNFDESAFDLATENESFTKGNVSLSFLK